MLGLQCDDENFKSYGDEGKTLAALIDPETIPGSEPFPESAFQPVVVQKCDLVGKKKMKGNPSRDCEYNRCVKNARTKLRKRNNNDTLTCVDRWHKDLGQSDSNDMRPWKDAMAERWKLKEFTVEHAAEFDAICNAAELAKDTMEFDPHTAKGRSSGKCTVIIIKSCHQMSSREQELSKTSAENLEVSLQVREYFAVEHPWIIRRIRTSVPSSVPERSSFIKLPRRIVMPQTLEEHPVHVIGRIKPLTEKGKIKEKMEFCKIKD